MAKIDENYSSLITSQYQNSTKYLLWVEKLEEIMDGVVNVADTMNAKFDIDLAVGPQLDVLGDIIGFSRNLLVPLTGVWFSWYDGTVDTENVGWSAGSWRDPAEGPISISGQSMSILPDDSYRQMLKFKIIQNIWDGTAKKLYEAFEEIFPGYILEIIDNQDMSAMFIITGDLIPTTIRTILSQSYVPVKPCGVSLSYRFCNIVKEGTWTAGENYVENEDAYAFLYMPTEDLSPYKDGNHMIEFFDVSGTLLASAWIGPEDPTEVLGDQLITGWQNSGLETLTPNANVTDIDSYIEDGSILGTAYEYPLVLSNVLYKSFTDITLNSGVLPELRIYKGDNSGLEVQRTLAEGENPIYHHQLVAGNQGNYQITAKGATNLSAVCSFNRVLTPPASGAILYSTFDGSPAQRGWWRKRSEISSLNEMYYEIKRIREE